VIHVNSENPDKEVLELKAASLASAGISPDVIVISPIDSVEFQVVASSGRILMPL
jgi:hypothetical protein